jgi:hypothetical protein
MLARSSIPAAPPSVSDRIGHSVLKVVAFVDVGDEADVGRLPAEHLLVGHTGHRDV